MSSVSPQAHLPTVDLPQIVPEACLEWPDRTFPLADEAALWIDEHLRRLARQENLCRRTLGRLARVFSETKGFDDLGFVRLSDWSRERLGLSAREVQDLSRVSFALDRFSALASAFEAGELSWTKARVLASVLEPGDQERWVELARPLTVRRLEAVVKEERERRKAEAGRGKGDEAGRDKEGGGDRAGTSSTGVFSSARAIGGRSGARGAEADGEPGIVFEGDEEDAVVEGEPRVWFRLRCPRWVAASFRRAVEFARRMTGEELAVWKAAEAMAAEAFSGSPERFGKEPTGDLARVRDRVEYAVDDLPERSGEAWGCFEWEAVCEAIPERVERLGEGLGGLDAFELDARMRRVVAAMQRVDFQMGRLLHVFTNRKFHLRAEFRSFGQYVRERLGISVRKARFLLALDRKAVRVEGLGEAYRDGKLSWVRAAVLMPVLESEDYSKGYAEERNGAWFRRAAQVPVKRLVEEVEWALTVHDATNPLRWTPLPPPLGARLELPEVEVQMRARHWAALDTRVEFSGPASVVGFFVEAVEGFRTSSWEPGWLGLARLVEHARGEWERRPPKKHDVDPVVVRDGYRCNSPTCTSRRNLQVHHVIPRSEGGPLEEWNEVATCVACHLRRIHRGKMRCRGRAPDGLRWDLGLRPGRPALLRFRGCVYAEAAEAAAQEGVHPEQRISETPVEPQGPSPPP